MAAILANYNLISWCQRRDILGFPNWKMKWPVLPGCSMSCLIDGTWRTSKTSETTRAVSFSSQCVLFSVGSKAPYLSYISAWCLNFWESYLDIRSPGIFTKAARPHARQVTHFALSSEVQGMKSTRQGSLQLPIFTGKNLVKWLVHVGSKVLNHWILRCPNFQTKA